MKEREPSFFRLSDLLAMKAPEGQAEGFNDNGPRPTEKEFTVFQRSKLSRRVRWLLLRRATDDGRVIDNALQRAREVKLERFAGSEFLNTGPTGPGCNWLSLGPRNINGRIKCVAIHPSNAQILYAGSPAGGVWKTTDGGQSWKPTMHDEASLAIGAIAVDPNAANTIYAGTGEPVYYFSGGVLQPPGSSRLAWYYPGVGIYRSTNGGDSWTLTGAIDNRFIYKIAVDPFDSQNVLCAGYSLTTGVGGLCRSTNGGGSWTTVQTGIFTDVLFDPNNSGVVYAASNNGGVWKSTDSGAMWAQRNNGLPAVTSIGRVSLTIARANSNVLYAKIENDATGGYLGVYRTTTAAEGAGAWTACTNPNVDSGFLWWCSYIAADPSDATGNIVWAGGVNIARSGDGGATWNAVTDAYGGTRPPTHADQHDLVFDPANSNNVYIANDGGVFRGAFTGGATPVTWTKVSTGLAVTQFYDLNASPAVRSMFGGGAQDNGSMISTGGQSYRHVFGGDGGYVAFHPTDPYTLYVQYQGGQVQRSTNGANSFSAANSGISPSGGTFPATVLAIDPNNPLILFCGTDRVYRTTNGGVGAGAWSAASGAIGPVTEVTIAPSSSAIVYAGALNGRLYRATDGGVTAASFVDITPAVGGFPTRWLAGIAVHPTDANIIYVTFLGFNGSGTTSDHVWRGVFNPGPATWTWTQRSTGLPDVPVGALAIDPGTMNLYVATDIGVFRSVDDGMNWTPFEAGLPNVPVVDLAIDPVRNVMRAATHGRGIYQIDLDGVCPEVDIYLRDNIIDTGEVTPSPTGVADPTQPGVLLWHYQSADIKVDAQMYDPTDALTDGVEFDDPVHPYSNGPAGKIEDIAGIEHNNPIRTQVNRVYVQVHNRGWNKADSVTVKLMYADAGAGLPALPGDYWGAFPADTFDQTNWKPLGTVTITDLLPNVPRVLSFDWTPPMGVSDHVCLLAMVHSPQDPLLPEATLNVDSLTRANKRVTHKNVHPVNPSAPAGMSPAIMWTSLNFNNGFAEHKFFDFRVENITRGESRLRIILPKVQLQESIERSVGGLKRVEISGDELRKLAANAATTGQMSEYVAGLLNKFDEPLVLEVEPGSDRAELRGVLIPPGGKVPAVFTFIADAEVERSSPFQFAVNQYASGELIGGSVFELASQTTERTTRRLRVILEKVQILDDKDPCIFGRGEFAFGAMVKVNDLSNSGLRFRIPEHGYIKVSDKPDKNVVELNHTIFDSYVAPNDKLTIALIGRELDIFTHDDETTRYMRTFEGDPSSWIGIYRPGDESIDPETMRDWHVWYRIEEV